MIDRGLWPRLPSLWINHWQYGIQSIAIMFFVRFKRMFSHHQTPNTCSYMTFIYYLYIFFKCRYYGPEILIKKYLNFRSSKMNRKCINTQGTIIYNGRHLTIMKRKSYRTYLTAISWNISFLNIGTTLKLRDVLQVKYFILLNCVSAELFPPFH